MMKKALLLLTIISLPLFASAQTTEKQYYIYNIATFYGSMNNKNISVYLDDGKNVKMLKDEDGEKINYSDVGLEDNDTTIVVINHSGAALPSTGGPGTSLFMILGSILITGAGLLLWRKRNTI